MDFTGKRVVVAGGSRGIGRSTALAFAQAGAAVSICARGAEGVEAARGELTALGGQVHAAVCDLSSAEAIAAYIPQAAEALGGIDVLVNNASGFGMQDDEAGWAAAVTVDMMAIVRASQAAQPWLERSAQSAGGSPDGGPSIVNISSISAYRASRRGAPYGAIKAAVIHYTTSQAAVLARLGIRVNCVAPGSIEFPGGTWEKRRTDNPALYASALASIPFGRMGEPEEVADVVLFLASRHARWMTAQTLIVDGGQLLGA